MADWQIYNIMGCSEVFSDYQFPSRPDWDWQQQVNPTPDVSFAFRVAGSSSKNEGLREELYSQIKAVGGGHLIRYDGSTTSGRITCSHIQVDDNGDAECVQTWAGSLISIERVAEDTLYDEAEHEWADVDHSLTIAGVPFFRQDVDDHNRDPDPRFHSPLLKVVEEETSFKTLYRGEWGHGWRTAGGLPECVYQNKEIPDHIQRRETA